MTLHDECQSLGREPDGRRSLVTDIVMLLAGAARSRASTIKLVLFQKAPTPCFRRWRRHGHARLIT